jgi:hypothetical protein
MVRGLQPSTEWPEKKPGEETWERTESNPVVAGSIHPKDGNEGQPDLRGFWAMKRNCADQAVPLRPLRQIGSLAKCIYPVMRRRLRRRATTIICVGL